MHDEETIGAASDRGNLNAGTTERRQRFVQFELAACKRTNATKSPTDCTLVACQLKQTANATSWFARVPAAKRSGVASKCRAFGVKLGRSAPVGPNCDVDPSRCQF